MHSSVTSTEVSVHSVSQLRCLGGGSARPGNPRLKPFLFFLFASFRAACMSNPMRRRKAVTKEASENGALSSSQEASLVTIALATDERTSLVAARTHRRPAAGGAPGRIGRYASQRLDLVAKQGPPSWTWFNSNR